MTTPAAKDINVKAFLKLIRFAEHKREDDGVYYVIFGGGTFSDTSKHPNKVVTRWGHTSSAAGAYQILHGTWEEAKKLGIMMDFTPASQDKFAIWKLNTRGALPFVEAGEVEKAIARCVKEWRSLPGATQSGIKMADAKAKFQQYVGEYSKQ